MSSSVLNKYLLTLSSQMRNKNVKDFDIEKVRAHLIVHANAYLEMGDSEEIAISKAISDMGDPANAGADVDYIRSFFRRNRQDP